MLSIHRQFKFSLFEWIHWFSVSPFYVGASHFNCKNYNVRSLNRKIYFYHSSTGSNICLVILHIICMKCRPAIFTRNSHNFNFNQFVLFVCSMWKYIFPHRLKTAEIEKTNEYKPQNTLRTAPQISKMELI